MKENLIALLQDPLVLPFVEMAIMSKVKLAMMETIIQVMVAMPLALLLKKAGHVQVELLRNSQLAHLHAETAMSRVSKSVMTATKL